jgi:hypothetical protein
MFTTATIKAGTTYYTVDKAGEISGPMTAAADIEVSVLVASFEEGEMSLYADAAGNEYYVKVEDDR